MEVKEAVSLAKQYVHDLFADERIDNLGLEEVVFDEKSKTWSITVGFSRPWDSPNRYGGILPAELRRSYKVVKISDADKVVQSVKERTLLPSPV